MKKLGRTMIIILLIIILLIMICCLPVAFPKLHYPIGPLYFSSNGIATYWKIKPHAKDLDFDFSMCDRPGPDYSPTVQKTEWVGENELSIEGLTSSSCSAKYWLGNYSMVSDHQILLEYTTLGYGSSACSCPVELHYTISNLEHQEYIISIIETD
jgi:hypothetical protein